MTVAAAAVAVAGAIAACGGRPSTARPGAEPAIRVTGTFVRDGQPKSAFVVELCAGVTGVFAGPTPCTNKRLAQRAVTDTDGRFELGPVPPAGWHLVYQRSRDSWVFFFPAGCCGGVRDGAAFDIGRIELDDVSP